MELRSYNVVRIYKDTVKCRIGDKLCVDKEKLEKNASYIRELLLQIKAYNEKNARITYHLWYKAGIRFRILTIS